VVWTSRVTVLTDKIRGETSYVCAKSSGYLMYCFLITFDNLEKKKVEQFLDSAMSY
jgi:hypothetical protein